MPDEHSENIFDHASNMFEKGKKKNKGVKPSESKPSEGKSGAAKKKRISPQKKRSKPKSPQPPQGPYFDDPELEHRYREMERLRDNLIDRIDKACELMKTTPKEISEKLDNTHNLSIEDVQRLKKRQKELDQELFKGQGLVIHRKFKKKKLKKRIKGRKGKSLGARKGWISMD